MLSVPLFCIFKLRNSIISTLKVYRYSGSVEKNLIYLRYFPVYIASTSIQSLMPIPYGLLVFIFSLSSCFFLFLFLVLLRLLRKKYSAGSTTFMLFVCRTSVTILKLPVVELFSLLTMNIHSGSDTMDICDVESQPNGLILKPVLSVPGIFKKVFTWRSLDVLAFCELEPRYKKYRLKCI